MTPAPRALTVEPRKPARAAGANTARLGGSVRPHREMCWADCQIPECNFHCLQLAAPTPDHLEEIFGITAEARGQGLGRVP